MAKSKYDHIDFVQERKKYSSNRQMAEALGINESVIRRRLKKAATKERLTEKLDDKIPFGQKLRGVSTLYNSDGEATMQWVKTNADMEQQKKAFEAAIKAMAQDIPKQTPIKFSIDTNANLCACYVISDYHLGMLSWPDETGEDWNIELAENMLVNWFSAAIQKAKGADTAVLAQLGDFLHWDGLDAVTPTSGHVLDADSRFPEIVMSAIRVLRKVVNMLLENHKHVHIVMAEGNHDLSSSVWLRALFAEKYEDEPRVTIDNTHTPYYAYEWGKTSLFFHHGHKKQNKALPEVFAAMYRDMFGRTEHTYAHVGHRHHHEAKENGLMIVEQHQTLASKDSHAIRGGYSSKRSAKVITYHKEYGEVSRDTIRPEMIM